MSGEGFGVVCRYCNHSPDEHNLYGCGHWFTPSEWENGICGCSWTRDQLLEIVQ